MHRYRTFLRVWSLSQKAVVPSGVMLLLQIRRWHKAEFER